MLRSVPLRASTCWLVDSDSFAWLLIQPGEYMQADVVPSHEDAHESVPAHAHPGPSRQRWRRDALQPSEVRQPQCDRDTCIHIPERSFRCASWNSRGLLGSTASSQTSREQKHRYLERLIDKNDVVCLQET